MLQIGYFSSAKGPQDATVVHRILVAARKANQRDFITGLLVVGGGRYLQVIEGPTSAVDALYRNIETDERHVAVTRFLTRKIDARSFGSWSMAFRRPTQPGAPNSFLSVFGALIAQVPDSALRSQVRHLVNATIMVDARTSAAHQPSNRAA